jgi:hypothetical protein
LHAIKAVVLEAVDPDSLDTAQRAALIEYVLGGGIVVFAAPIDAAARGGSSLASLLPVSLVGSREARQIEVSPGGAALKLREPCTIVEAVAASAATEAAAGAGDAQVLLRDRDYVHVAVRPVGLGKVVFTSFPINALDPAQPQTAALWEQLLSLRQPQWDWSQAKLGEARHDVIGTMVGRKVAPWAVAAGVAAGYVLLIVAAQALFFGAARPRAFVVSVVAAVLFSVTLLAMGVARRGGDRTMQSARLGVIDVAPDGGGWRREVVAYVGDERPDMKLQTADESTLLRPALADARNRPTVRQQPFAVENAQVFTDRIERVWEASRPLEQTWGISAAAQLGASGVTMDVDNRLGRTLESPLIIWNGRALAMSDLPAGRSTVRELERNPRGQFTGRGVLTSEEAKRRGHVIAASLAPANETALDKSADAPPMLVGWIAEAGQPLAGPVKGEGIETRSMTMIRTPLRFNIAPPGSGVLIPAALVRIDTGRMAYDHAKGESVPTPQPGSWPISFAPPRQTGMLKPAARITVAARVALPAHTLRLRMGSRQSDAKPVEWSRTVGPVEATFDAASGDFDEHGRIGMMLEVESHDTTNSVPWQISDLGGTIEGTIAGPPPPIVLDATKQSAGETKETSEADGEDEEKFPRPAPRPATRTATQPARPVQPVKPPSKLASPARKPAPAATTPAQEKQ